MAVTSDEVRRRITAASWIDSDNEAVRIVNAATSAEIAALDANAVLILFRTLYGGNISADDRHAITLLKSRCGFPDITSLPGEAVDAVLAGTPASNGIAHRFLTASMVMRIYAAEAGRLSWLERHGVDGATIGRGQLGKPAYTDVKAAYPTALQAWSERIGVSTHLPNAAVTTGVKWAGGFTNCSPRDDYSYTITEPAAEDFVVAAYLAILIKRSTKPARPDKDVLRIAVALYHGMRAMVVAAQTASGQTTHWAPIEAKLRSAGHTDEADYVLEVIP